MEGLRAGVGPLGFTDLAEIKLVICYLLSCCEEPLSKEQIFDILDLNRIVNYFYFSQALEELIRNGQVKRVDGRYVPEKEGIESAQTLKETLAQNIRELLASSAMNYGKKINFEKWHNIQTKKDEFGYTVTCEIADESVKLMSITLFVPEEKMLNTVKKRFKDGSEEIYKTIINLLTGEDFD
ncbi:hypothetical protein FACS189481_4730 [Clostridia bacterium]|nr:hypothetical protein FACS189481_4730 [Clostridia bacterium]